MNKVIWDEEMSTCIGMTCTMTREDFMEAARNTHRAITGEGIPEFTVKHLNSVDIPVGLWVLTID